MKKFGTVYIVAVVLLFLATMMTFTVDERQYAIVFRLGEITSVKKEPGLYFKLPFVENVKHYEKRIVTLDWNQADRFITREKKNLIVDFFVKWKIIDPKKYQVSVAGNELEAKRRIAQTVNDGLRSEFGKRTVNEVVSGERGTIMQILRKTADQKMRRDIGAQIIDVRLRRVDLPEKVSDSVYGRMATERKSVANQLRSEGAEAAERIRADADKQREVILAEAYKDAQVLKGEGDGIAAEIYANAYNKNPDFYAFYRSQEAYKKSFNNKSDIMVLDQGSDFFKYMRSLTGNQ